MEQQFFSIVRATVLLLTTLLFALILVFGVMAIMNFLNMQKVDRQMPVVTIESFQNKPEQSDNTNQSGVVEKNANDKASKQEVNKLQVHYESFVSSLNTYLSQENLAPVDTDRLSNWLNKILQNYDEETGLSLMKQFDDAGKEMLALDQAKRNQFPPYDFLDWYAMEFERQVKEEQKRLSLAQIEAEEAKSGMMTSLMVVGAASVVFVLLVMILVLLRIESNTRPNQSAV